MIINTNIVSLNTQNMLRQTNSDLETHMARLSSGKRINSAADDAAGIAIATRMDSKLRGMDVGIRNSNDGISLVQTAESALGSISNILQRMRELAVQSSNGTNNSTDRASLDNEFGQLKSEINHISGTTTFNGVSLLDGSGTSVQIQLSDVANDSMTLNLINSQTSALNSAGAGGGVGLNHDITTAANATSSLDELDSAILDVSNMRAQYGANLNRLNFNVDNMNSAKTNLSAAQSRIQDADMSQEVSQMTKDKILMQSGMAMLSHANQDPQMITQLLQG